MRGTLIAATGAWNTGKTTAVLKKVLDLRMKAPGKSIRPLIDVGKDCPYPAKDGPTRERQAWLFADQVRQELTMLACHDIVVVDHTVVDVIAFTMMAGFDGLAHGMVNFAESHICIYKQIYFKRVSANEINRPESLQVHKARQIRLKFERTLEGLYQRLFTDPAQHKKRIVFS